uniref:Polypyrimidine tract-binding protein 1-like n=1 Tax=Phallusia mammillata TaxID=59560 RepID=A0A6F9DQS1_9ASCI|nr:polypyrimidine tract-binding protein 1-like [Phallusia mammillata]
MSLVFLPVTGGPAMQQIAMQPLPGQGTVCIAGAQPPMSQQFVFSAPAPAFERPILHQATKRNNEDTSHLLAGSVDNGAKKIKTERLDPSVVSRVVHLRSLPSDVSETEVIQLGMSFGRVTNILMLKGKNQAFLEMEDEEAATMMVTGSEVTPPSIRDRLIFVQFSNHKELKTDNSPNQLKAQAALQAMQQGDAGGGQNHVLRIVVENMLYPITIDILHTIFSKFGVVLKIITFNKNNQFQALLQMGDAIQSQTAKLSLDGQNIYNSCCTLRIEYSKLTSLNVKYNNDKSRDYTRNDLPSGESSILGQNALSNVLTGAAGLMPSPYTSQAAIAALQQNPLASLVTSNVIGMNSGAASTSSLGNTAVAAQLAAFVGVNNAVLHVSNLNEEMVTPQALFVLFGVYGDVIRVKILFQNQNSALVQMNDYTQAQLVIRFLHGVKLFGRGLKIVMSKHSQVQMPKEGQEMSKLTQDYTNSPLHRFKKPGSKNFQNIFPPSEVLHLSNIPPETTEEFLTELFSQNSTVQAFKFFAKDRRMALVKLASIDEAVKCLVLLHNAKLSETNHLRVSFSKGHI